MQLQASSSLVLHDSQSTPHRVHLLLKMQLTLQNLRQGGVDLFKKARTTRLNLLFTHTGVGNTATNTSYP